MKFFRIACFLLSFSSVLSLLAVGCRTRERGEREDVRAVDVELMAFLSEARALHHQANIKEGVDDLEGAVTAMERLVTARRPHAEAQGTNAPEVDEVLADAYARLAELRLRQRRHDAAAEAIAKGLTHAPSTTYFRGHLLEIEGLIEEARAAEWADAGKPQDAERARERAMALLEEVVRIQDDVIRRSLEARDASPAENGK